MMQLDMLENIARHRESGESLLQAVLKGSREMIYPYRLTVSLIAVLIPLLFSGRCGGTFVSRVCCDFSSSDWIIPRRFTHAYPNDVCVFT